MAASNIPISKVDGKFQVEIDTPLDLEPVFKIIYKVERGDVDMVNLMMAVDFLGLDCFYEESERLVAPSEAIEIMIACPHYDLCDYVLDSEFTTYSGYKEDFRFDTQGCFDGEPEVRQLNGWVTVGGLNHRRGVPIESNTWDSLFRLNDNVLDRILSSPKLKIQNVPHFLAFLEDRFPHEIACKYAIHDTSVESCFRYRSYHNYYKIKNSKLFDLIDKNKGKILLVTNVDRRGDRSEGFCDGIRYMLSCGLKAGDVLYCKDGWENAVEPYKWVGYTGIFD